MQAILCHEVILAVFAASNVDKLTLDCHGHGVSESNLKFYVLSVSFYYCICILNREIRWILCVWVWVLLFSYLSRH
jgi:hypothetical protein